MKQKILFLVLLFVMALKFTNAQQCTTLGITSNRQVYCYYDSINICLESLDTNLLKSTYTLFKRVQNTTKWEIVKGGSIRRVNQALCLKGYNFFNYAAIPYHTLPIYAPLTLDLAVVANGTQLNTCNPTNFITITINPVPKIFVKPDASFIRYVCRGHLVTDTFKLQCYGTDSNSNANNSLSYQWDLLAGIVRSQIGNTSTVVPSSTNKVGDNYYFATVTNQFGCQDSIPRVRVIIRDTAKSTSYLTICADKLPFLWNGLTFIKEGSNTVYLPTTNSIFCDSLATLWLSITKNLTKITTASICNKFLPYQWNGRNFYTSKDTTIRINYGGVCDSLLVLKLTVKSSSSSTLNKNICNGAYVLVGTTKKYTTSGVYKDTLVNKVDCASIITLNLTVLPPTVAKDTTLGFCPKNISTLNGKKYDSSGVYYDTIKNSAGCDSIRYKITINELQPTSYTKKDTICSSRLSTYYWNGVTITKSGTYNKTFTGGNAVGCDSTAILRLVVRDSSTYTFSRNICRDSSVSYWGQVFTTTGKYTNRLKNKAGCDSIVTLILTVKQPSTSTTTANICSTCSYTFNGLQYHTEGVYTTHLTNAAGCDSAATLILRVGQIGGDSVICQTDTAYYFIKNLQANTLYNWVSIGGTIYGSDSAASVKVLFDSTTNTSVIVTARDSVTKVVLYSDTIKVKVGKQPQPLLATTGGVSCQVYKDTIIDGTIIHLLPLLDSNSSCAKVCEHNSYKYYAKDFGTAGSSYRWTITGGTPATATGDSIWVQWGNAGTGNLTLEAITAARCSASRSYCFAIIPSPQARFTAHLSSADTVEGCKRAAIPFSQNSVAFGSNIIDWAGFVS